VNATAFEKTTHWFVEAQEGEASVSSQVSFQLWMFDKNRLN
jgi:hypothetical protein